MRKLTDFPPFARFGASAGYRGPRIVLQHVGGGVYYRAAGHWQVTVRCRDGRFFVKRQRGSLAHTSGSELFRSTRKAWKESNAGYV